MDERRLLVLSTLFPTPARPTAGIFIRERMFRVAKHLPVTVLSPQPWFPGQGLIRLLRPDYRPPAPRLEVSDGIEIMRPRFLAVPSALRWLDGLSMAICSYLTVRRLKRRLGVGLIDAHFTFPDGEAAVRLGRWLGLPVSVTLRGTEVPHSRHPQLRNRLARTLRHADWVFAVSDSLKRLALELGAVPEKVEVVGNGVDLHRFQRMDKAEARRKYDLPQHAKILISVGALVERKGIHRVIECMPALLQRVPEMHYVVVGGASPEGNIEGALRIRCGELGLSERVHFLGALPPDSLKWPLSAADVFVLPTRNEGWANVFLEAFACGLPVVTTDVGGNAEVVCRSDLGRIVPFGDAVALQSAIVDALERDWDRRVLRDYAEGNSWDARVAVLVRRLGWIADERSRSAARVDGIAGAKS